MKYTELTSLILLFIVYNIYLEQHKIKYCVAHCAAEATPKEIQDASAHLFTLKSIEIYKIIIIF